MTQNTTFNSISLPNTAKYITLLILFISINYGATGLKNLMAQELKGNTFMTIDEAYRLGGYTLISNGNLYVERNLAAGIGKGGWILKGQDKELIVIGFEWSVRPGIKAIANRAQILREGKLYEVPCNLESQGRYEGEEIVSYLHGTISSGMIINIQRPMTKTTDPALKALLKEYDLTLVTNTKKDF